MSGRDHFVYFEREKRDMVILTMTTFFNEKMVWQGYIF